MRAIDVSYWSKAGGVTEADWRAALAEGYELAIVGAFHGVTRNTNAESTLRNARRAGMLTAAYGAVHPQQSGAEAVNITRQMCGSEWAPLRYVEVDVERPANVAGPGGITVPMVREALARVYALGKRPVIYTGAWWWRGHFGDPRDFADVPLHTADYDGNPTLDFPDRYGGWTRKMVVGKQYLGDRMWRDIKVDFNIFDGDWVRSNAASPAMLIPRPVPLPTPPSAPPPGTPAATLSDYDAGWNAAISAAKAALDAIRR